MYVSIKTFFIFTFFKYFLDFVILVYLVYFHFFLVIKNVMGNFNFDLSRVQTRSNFLSKTILKVGNQLLIVYTNIKKKNNYISL